MTLLYGHLGTDHWWASLLYLLPVVVVVAGIWVTGWRDRRNAPQEAQDGDAAKPTDPPAAP